MGDNDVRRELLNTQWAYAVLAMDMFIKGTRSNESQRPVHWTPCTNLAFTMCALRGYLSNDVPQFAEGSAGRLYLATKGADLLRRCRPDVLVQHLLHPHTKCSGSSCRQFDATWDECYITKSEYCTIAGACANGYEVWNTTGEWV